MSANVLETRLDQFIEMNKKYGDGNLKTFVDAHSFEDIPHYFLVCPSLDGCKDRLPKGETRRYRDIFEEAEAAMSKINNPRNTLVFELIVCNLWDKATNTCSPVWLGRNQENDIRLDWMYLSGRHGCFTIKKENGIYVLNYLDDNSTNGTSINGKRVIAGADIPIMSGSSLNIGDDPEYKQMTVFSPEHMFDMYIKQ
jgi:hypothetical protein